jgi:phage terminase large subunit
MKTPKLNSKYNALGNDTRYFVVTGGRGSGKSFAVNAFLAFLTMEEGHKILFTRYTMTSAATSIIPEFIEKLELYGIREHFSVYKDEIVNKATGSSIMFKGIRTSSGNQTAALKSLQGVTTFVVDEAEELVDEDTFDKIDQSVRVKGKQNRVILILNPTTKNHWIYERFFAMNFVREASNTWKSNVTYIHTTFKDNIDNLSESFLEQLDQIRRRRPDRYTHQILGGWLDKAEGTVFQNWRAGEFNEYSESTVFGQDFGFAADPSTLIKISVDPDKRVMWVKEMFVKAGLKTQEISRLNKRYAQDSLIIADNSEPRMLAEMKETYGINIRPTVKRAGSILTGIALMQDYDIIVDPKSENIIRELNNYVWHHRNEKPIDKRNHTIDAIRYGLQYLDANSSKGVYVIR